MNRKESETFFAIENAGMSLRSQIFQTGEEKEQSSSLEFIKEFVFKTYIFPKVHWV